MPARRNRLKVPLLVLVASLLAGLAWWKFGDGKPAAAAAATATVQRASIENTVSALGKIGPKTYVDVGAQLSGQLETLSVEVGDRVEQGALLAQIDPRIYESRVAGDRARVDSLTAQLAERNASMELARINHTRNQAMADRNLIARDLLDTSAAQLKQAQAQVASVRAQLKEAQSTLDGDAANLGYARIYAPMSGTVVSISALEGQTLNANQVTPTILRIADLDTMTVTAQVAEADIGRVQTEMPVYFTTLGQANRRWQGSVRQIQPTPDIVNEVVLFRVLVDVDNRDGVLLPDMTAQVFFVLAQARDVLTLPAAAVSNSSESKDKGFVQVPGPSGPTQRAVETGLRNRELVEIVSGLAEGDSVLLPAAGPSTTAKASESPPRRGLLGGPH